MFLLFILIDSVIINKQLNEENITSFALPSELSFIENGDYYSNDIYVGNIFNTSNYLTVTLKERKIEHYRILFIFISLVNYSIIDFNKYVRLPNKKIYRTNSYPYDYLSIKDIDLIDGKAVMNKFINSIKLNQETIIKSPVYKTKLYGISYMINNPGSSNYAVIMLSDKRLSIVFRNYTGSGYVITKYTYHYSEIDDNPNMLNVTKFDENNKESKYGLKYKTPFIIIIKSKSIISEYFNVNIYTKKSYEVNTLINSTLETKPITSYTFVIANDNNDRIEGFTSGFYYSISQDSYILHNITEFIDDKSYTFINITGMSNLYCFAVPFDAYNIYCSNIQTDVQYNWLNIIYNSNDFIKYSKLCILIFNYYIL